MPLLRINGFAPIILAFVMQVFQGFTLLSRLNPGIKIVKEKHVAVVGKSEKWL